MKILHLIFDVDQTLVDWKKGYTSVEEWVNKVAKEVLKKYNYELYEKLTIDDWKNIFKGKISRNIISKEVWIELDKKDLAYRKELLTQGCAELYKDVYCLKEIKIEKSVVSNGATESIAYTLEFFGIKDWFKVIQGKFYENVDWCKPNPEQLILVIEKLKLTPNEVAYIGDSSIDVKAANRAGCISVYINREGKRNEEAKFNISSLCELKYLFEL